jgi:hypothetical protein
MGTIPNDHRIASRIALALLLAQSLLPEVDEWLQMAEAEGPAAASAGRELLRRWLELQADAQALQTRQALGLAQGVA